MGSIRDMANGLKVLPRWNDYDQIALEALASLRSLFRDACTRYSSRKQELVALDYLDLEIRATELLSEHPEIAAAYGSRLRHLMVDELQDTNPTQIKFLDLLKGPERFFVGDVKQAIYRFRGSDVRNFTRLHTRISASGAIHSLSQSFRAHDPLVGSLNALFEHVFADAREEFEAPMQAMTGRGTEAPESPYLVLLPVSNQTPEGGKTVDEERRKVEADAVAAEVASLLGRPVDVWDRDEGEQRPARASDVADPAPPADERPPLRAGAGEPRSPLPHGRRRRVLHQAGGPRSHQPPGLAGRAGRHHRPGGRPPVAAVHHRRPVPPGPSVPWPESPDSARGPARVPARGGPPVLQAFRRGARGTARRCRIPADRRTSRESPGPHGIRGRVGAFAGRRSGPGQHPQVRGPGPPAGRHLPRRVRGLRPAPAGRAAGPGRPGRPRPVRRRAAADRARSQGPAVPHRLRAGGAPAIACDLRGGQVAHRGGDLAHPRKGNRVGRDEPQTPGVLLLPRGTGQGGRGGRAQASVLRGSHPGGRRAVHHRR